ncbi:MAG: hypothetical protein J5863_02795 [Desulfovibrio sp.]|nr:hypothetical protein [Desulfovibrio sp.]
MRPSRPLTALGHHPASPLNMRPVQSLRKEQGRLAARTVTKASPPLHSVSPSTLITLG